MDKIYLYYYEQADGRKERIGVAKVKGILAKNFDNPDEGFRYLQSEGEVSIGGNKIICKGFSEWQDIVSFKDGKVSVRLETNLDGDVMVKEMVLQIKYMKYPIDLKMIGHDEWMEIWRRLGFLFVG